ncbi:B3 domain-containing protein At4g01580-like [Chenopodium quinoa]|uniref:B3 domain-containing protein At4g01580-like n=1 Tax=Chenopodium quinoa TaxID=63459 RepID=UPI000B788827|nr:B3 domain-containing protein At4g01580-like [Chenopodium quinoa]
MIPEKFARAFGEELSDVAILRVPTGETRKVAIVEEGDNLWFHDGWQDFVECYSIGYASFLLFKYDGNSNFCVHIFDRSACEISYQCNAVARNNVIKPQYDPCPEQIDDDAQESREILHSEEIIELDSDDETNDARECSPFVI